MKSSASPCPLDQISIIAFKKCPYLRTHLWRIITNCWTNSFFPTPWKKAVTILIYKKGSNTEPENFRPITLQPVLSKIFTSIIRNRIYNYVASNKYIESNLQKGFWEKISGCIEHTETLTYVIDHARRKQKSLVVTLLDLKNAFGEVDHSLLENVLKYHNIPEHIISLIRLLYQEYYTSIATDNFVTSPIIVKRGVLQGDSLSPLLFNLVVNTLINTIKQEKINCLGYVFDGCVPPKHWMQFADDTAIVTSLESDNQHLVNAFSKWAQWAGLIIRVDKCSTFGIKKSQTSSIQYEPYVIANNKRIPTIENGKTFTYLGKDFSFNMNCNHVKDELSTELEAYLLKTHNLPLHPLQKIEICQRYIMSKFKWKFSIYDLSQTWVKENMDNKFSKFFRKWLQIPVSGNITHLTLPHNKLGLNIKSASTIYNECKLSVRRILKCSNNVEAQKLYQISTLKNINNDTIINNVTSNNNLENNQIKLKCSNILNNNCKQNTWNKFLGLSEQSVIIEKLINVCLRKDIISWQNMIKRLPISLFNFSRRYLISSLANNSNLYRWKISPSPSCCLCSKNQTQLHVFNHCETALERYTWRHNSILSTLAKKLTTLRGILYVDLEGYNNPSLLFKTKRPDLAFFEEKRLVVVELTCPYETNIISSRNYKAAKYKELKLDLIKPVNEIKLILLEITSLGFVGKSSKEFSTFLKQNNININMNKLCEVSLRCSYYIYCRRNKSWTQPELLSYDC